MNRIRILVVDDERVIADTLALILCQNGYDAMSAYSGEEAVQSADGSGPDVFISDINMGKINGIEAAIAIKRTRPDCHVLLFSGQPASEELLNHAKAQGYLFDALIKPVHPQTLLNWLVRKGLKNTGQGPGTRE